MSTSRLAWKGADGRDQVFVLSSPEIVIGRKSDVDLVVSHQHVSRRHAKLVAVTEGHQLVDLGSTYGTFVNNQRVERCLLRHGDRVLFGKDNLEFHYLVGDAPPPRQDTTQIMQKSLGDLNRVLPSAVSDLEKMLCVLDFQYQWSQVFTPENGLQQILESALKKHGDEPLAYIALAQLYADTDRGGQAVKTLQDAQAKFPKDNAIAFELGTVFDKQKQFPDAEAAFRQVLAREPENAAALNYLGYMLAERGERLDESVAYLKKALQLEPENGSYLDSLGWAYFKSDKLDLAADNLRRAADQLKTNSVIQDHYGDVLFKLTRYDEAIAAWTRALAGDGDSIDRREIDKKIRTAKDKLPRR